MGEGERGGGHWSVEGDRTQHIIQRPIQQVHINQRGGEFQGFKCGRGFCGKRGFVGGKLGGEGFGEFIFLSGNSHGGSRRRKMGGTICVKGEWGGGRQSTLCDPVKGGSLSGGETSGGLY